MHRFGDAAQLNESTSSWNSDDAWIPCPAPFFLTSSPKRARRWPRWPFCYDRILGDWGDRQESGDELQPHPSIRNQQPPEERGQRFTHPSETTKCSPLVVSDDRVRSLPQTQRAGELRSTIAERDSRQLGRSNSAAVSRPVATVSSASRAEHRRPGRLLGS
jgi:hypothetical protein